MTWFADLSPCTYFGEKASSLLRAVGWLSLEHEFTTGEVTEEFFAKLTRLAAKPPQVFVFRGVYHCELCRFTGAARQQEFDGLSVKGVSHLNLFIPGDGFLFAAPESITHYVDAHHYRPPEEFVDAVLECAAPDTMDFKKQFLGSGGRELMRLAEGDDR